MVQPPPAVQAQLTHVTTSTPRRPLPSLPRYMQHAKELQKARQRASEEVGKAEKEALKARMDARHATALADRLRA